MSGFPPSPVCDHVCFGLSSPNCQGPSNGNGLFNIWIPKLFHQVARASPCSPGTCFSKGMVNKLSMLQSYIPQPEESTWLTYLFIPNIPPPTKKTQQYCSTKKKNLASKKRKISGHFLEAPKNHLTALFTYSTVNYHLARYGSTDHHQESLKKNLRHEDEIDSDVNECWRWRILGSLTMITISAEGCHMFQNALNPSQLYWNNHRSVCILRM